ncbi:MAG: hypothetical protein ABSB15_01435 [Bryobacteraceae bacterium]
MSALRRFFDFLAGMGLIVRDDPKKVVDLTVREWGAEVDGFVLSIREIPHEDPDAQAAVSMVLRNVGPAPRSVSVPGWLFFYRFEIIGPDGTAASMSSFGKELVKRTRPGERIEVALGPGEFTETQIPIGSMFSLSGKVKYRVRASCDLAEGVVLRSNEISI